MSIDNSKQISDVKVLLKTGIDGASVESIVKTASVGLVDTYTITLTNGEQTTFEVTNGNGIVSIAKTGTSGLVDTYTITFDNGTTTTFQVTNGSDVNAQIAEKVTNPAQKDYVVGRFVIFDEKYCKVTTPIASGGTFDIGTNLEETTVSDEMFPRDEQRVVGSKNLLPYPYFDTKIGNVGSVFTENEGVITVNGTGVAVTGSYYVISPLTDERGIFLLDKGTYRLTGGINDDLFISIAEPIGSYNLTGQTSDKGSGAIFTLSARTRLQVMVKLNAGKTVSSIAVKPLLTLASDNDRTFARPAFTNAKLTDIVNEHENDITKAKNGIVANTKLLTETVGWNSKNKIAFDLDILKANNVNGTWNGNVYTHNNGAIFTVNTEDNTIAVISNGETTGVSTIRYPQKIKAGKYLLNGGRSAENFVGLYNYDTSEYIATSTGDDEAITIEDEKTYGITWRVGRSQTISVPFEFKIMLRDADILDSSYEPYHSSVKDTLRNAEVIEGKNKLKNEMVNHDKNSVTFNVNSDKSITLSGTSSGDITVGDDNGTIGSVKNLPFGKYILSGCPAGGSGSTFRLVISNTAGTAWITDTGEGAEFELTNGHTWDKVYIRANTGVNLTGKVFKPMICLVTEADPTYEPFYIPLKDSKFPREEQRILGAKNLLDINTHTQSGATVTKYGNGLYIESDSDVAYPWVKFSSFPAGSYKVSFDIASISLPTGEQAMIGFRKSNNTFESKLNVSSNGHFEFDAVTTEETTFQIVPKMDDLVQSGQFIITNLMVTLVTDTDRTYAPYAMTNRELTEKKVDKNVRTLSSSDNLNDVTSTGFYSATSSPINAPESQSYFQMLVLGDTSIGVTRQIIYTSSGSNTAMYVRTYSGGTWKNWVKFTGTEIS